jgi:ABC-type glutathione transport system ATPase component
VSGSAAIPPAGLPLVSVSDLVKEFPAARGALGRRRGERVRAVNGVSFQVAAGETFGLVGETGSGKTTTARLIMGLLQPTSGSTHFAGEPREAQMVFQDPQGSLNPRKSVGAIIAAPLEIHGVGGGRDGRRARVRELMDLVGLNPEHYNRYPHEFSGGQRQRVGVARALALEPRLVIADEPVSALDVSIQAQILNLLRELKRELGLTLILISHDLAVVRYMSDRVGVMLEGRLVELAPVHQLYSAPRDEYTRALLAAVPRL